MINYSKLREVLEDSGYSYTYIANNIGMSNKLLERKLVQESLFKVDEADRLRKFLKLTDEQLLEIFFSDEDEVKTK